MSSVVAHEFHLIDLESQAYAVQQRLRGQPAAAKLAWLAERGDVTVHRMGDKQGSQDIYWFRSRLGFQTAFFLQGDVFVFIGDNTTWVARA